MSRVRSVEQPFASLHLSPCQFVEPTARRLVENRAWQISRSCLRQANNRTSVSLPFRLLPPSPLTVCGSSREVAV